MIIRRVCFESLRILYRSLVVIKLPVVLQNGNLEITYGVNY